MRVGTVTDHLAASKADYEGGDYSPEAEAAARAYERNRAELARQAEAAETAKPEHESKQRAIDDEARALIRFSPSRARSAPSAEPISSNTASASSSVARASRRRFARRCAAPRASSVLAWSSGSRTRPWN
jgi:hypothetical protein